MLSVRNQQKTKPILQSEIERESVHLTLIFSIVQPTCNVELYSWAFVMNAALNDLLAHDGLETLKQPLQLSTIHEVSMQMMQF